MGINIFRVPSDMLYTIARDADNKTLVSIIWSQFKGGWHDDR